MFDSFETAQRCADAADSKKAFNIIILDLRKLTYITDYFVICSGGSSTQVSAISDWIAQTLAKSGLHPSHIEGQAESSWVLIDYGDVVVHIFDERTRMHYSLEKLWSDADRVHLRARPPALTTASS